MRQELLKGFFSRFAFFSIPTCKFTKPNMFKIPFNKGREPARKPVKAYVPSPLNIVHVIYVLFIHV